MIGRVIEKGGHIYAGKWPGANEDETGWWVSKLTSKNAAINTPRTVAASCVVRVGAFCTIIHFSHAGYSSQESIGPSQGSSPPCFGSFAVFLPKKKKNLSHILVMTSSSEPCLPPLIKAPLLIAPSPSWTQSTVKGIPNMRPNFFFYEAEGGADFDNFVKQILAHIASKMYKTRGAVFFKDAYWNVVLAS